MSDWTEQFEQHALHSTLAQLHERLETGKVETKSQEADDLVGRIRHCCNHLSAILENAIPDITPTGVLNNINNPLNQILSELNHYISNGNVAHLNNTTNHITQAVNTSRQIPLAIAGGGRSKSFTSFFAQIKKQAASVVEALRSSAAELESTQATLVQRIDKEKSRLSALEQLLQNQDQRIDELATKFQDEFNDSKNSFESDMSAALEQEKEVNQSLRDDLNKQFEGQATKLDEAANEFLDQLQEKNVQASQLLEAIGNTGITGNYQKRAAVEGESADNWRRMSILFWLLLILTMLFTLQLSWDTDVDWHVFVFRVFIGVFFALPATYAAKESNKHRKLEGFYRQRELELASLGPYLEQMEGDVKNRLREELATLYFGQEPKYLEEKQKGLEFVPPKNFVEKLLDKALK